MTTKTLHHPDDPKAKVTVTEDQEQAYLDSGWFEKPAAAKADDK